MTSLRLTWSEASTSACGRTAGPSWPPNSTSRAPGARRARRRPVPGSAPATARTSTGITPHTGDNDVVDVHTAAASHTVKTRLDQLGTAGRLVDYGNGASLAPACDGGHNYGCWVPDFADYIPRLEAAFAAAG
ncbi:hypothetical protein [Streptomyces sp. NPDC054883]